ncbi:MAG: CHASE2 domain-containing protein [Thainema sp.]
MWCRSAKFLRISVQHVLQRKRRVEEIAVLVTVCIILLRMTGWLQAVEWNLLDRLFRLRGVEERDDRIVIVEINEDDLEQLGEWPISDKTLVQLLETIDQADPRAIGLDIYRDLPVGAGQAELAAFFQRVPYIYGIETLPDSLNDRGVDAPNLLQEKEQVGFNNVIIDADGVVRRNILYWSRGEGGVAASLSLQLALAYLQPEGIELSLIERTGDLQLGDIVLTRFRPNDGAYVAADAGGYQLLANYRGGQTIRTVSISEVLRGNVSSDIFRDRIVLIGSTAASLKDFFRTPLTRSTEQSRLFAGVELQADFTSQLISAALDDRPMLRVWPTGWAWLLILACAYGSATIVWYQRSLLKSTGFTLLLTVGVSGICVLAFFGGTLWLPILPCTMVVIFTATLTKTYQLQQAEKLKKSKEFLSSVINTIPDPIFVADQQQRWIVVNQAYCNFVGYPLDYLIEKTPFDIFPQNEALVFQQQYEQVFTTGEAQESEESFTDANGHTYLTATKRSLHRDSAGNLFLVGVIRDITDRKRLEQELRRTASELLRSNTELRKAEGRLRRLAYHDALTGLPNREFFYERFKESVVWATERDRMIGLLFIDLDGFKLINDHHGHDVGDQLLQAVAGRLAGCLRGSDIVSRLGGDEFTVLLPGIPDLDAAKRVAEKILAKLSQPFGLEEQRVSVTASIGISLYPLHGTDIESLMRTADSKMYQAKRIGKNQFAFEDVTASHNAETNSLRSSMDSASNPESTRNKRSAKWRDG